MVTCLRAQSSSEKQASTSLEYVTNILCTHKIEKILDRKKERNKQTKNEKKKGRNSIFWEVYIEQGLYKWNGNMI